MPDSPRTSAYDTDRTHFERSETSSHRASMDQSQGKHDGATDLADRDLEKSAPQPQAASDEIAPSPEPVAFGSDAPDGGFRAWLVVFGAWCSSFCTWGWING